MKKKIKWGSQYAVSGNGFSYDVSIIYCCITNYSQTEQRRLPYHRLLRAKKTEWLTWNGSGSGSFMRSQSRSWLWASIFSSHGFWQEAPVPCSPKDCSWQGNLLSPERATQDGGSRLITSSPKWHTTTCHHTNWPWYNGGGDNRKTRDYKH